MRPPRVHRHPPTAPAAAGPGEPAGHEGHRERLRRRWLDAGPEALADHELLELLLAYTVARSDTKPLARELIARFGSLEGVLRADEPALRSGRRVSERQAVLLALVRHLSARLAAGPAPAGQAFRGPEDTGPFLASRLAGLPEERFLVLLLDQRHRLIDCLELERGIENRAHVYVKKVVRAALDRHATAVVCGHNHPSGALEPSRADLDLTRTLKAALEPLEIRLLDHIIAAGSGWLSLSAEGRLP